MSELEKAIAEYQSFPDRFESAIVATVNSEGAPNASYAPFVMDANKNFYVFVTDLATHTSNLKATGKTSLLLIEDETKTKNIFGRKRLTLDCSATLIDPTSEAWKLIADLFQKRFGNIIEVIRNLNDFHIFQITPKEGLFVTGFGGAYKVSGEDLNTLTQVKHKA